MACLLKLPTQVSKGVVTFTTQEQFVINRSKKLKSILALVKETYVTGLHFNWHNYEFKPDPQFNFFMADEGDIKPFDDTPYHLIPIDACNFTPEVYSPGNVEKFWDVLIIGNPVFFKRPEVALRAIRQMFDTSGKRRVLYICPIPEYKKGSERTTFYNIREYYEALFTNEERNWFTLVTTTFNSPFPFDRHTLSVFYKNSKVFLHTPSDERRCRIAAYAWCAGLPVVAYPSVASILPENLQCEPAYFRVDSDEQYAAQITAALKAVDKFVPIAYQKVLSEKFMVNKLESRLKLLFEELQLPYEGVLLDKNLDLRLGWHHHNINGASNGLLQPLDQFMQELMQASSFTEEYKKELVSSDYPERIIAKEFKNLCVGNPEQVMKNAKYLKPLSFWHRVYAFFKKKLNQVAGLVSNE